MKKFLFILVLFFTIFTLTGCGSATCDVTFMDVDGTELETVSVNNGDIAVYSKVQSLVDKYFEYDDNNVTMFVGWDKSSSNIKKNATLKAKVITIPRSQNGEFPQTIVTEETILNALSSLSCDELGYYTYEGKKYARTDKNNNLDSNGEYYRLVEPIKWRYLSNDKKGNVKFISNDILTLKQFHHESNTEKINGVYVNNYEKSDINSWLNNEFINQTFSDKSLICDTHIDNSPTSTTDNTNPYCCEDFDCKVYLLSYYEVNKIYFTNSDKRAYMNGFIYVWWLRSPNSLFMKCAMNVTKDGYEDYDNVTVECGVRPAITFNFK